MDQPQAAETEPRTASSQSCCPVVELRQYRLRPGMRDTLIELFDREFVETQEAVGMRIVGQFRDLADPDRFVWLRGFADMALRGRALTAFYVEGAAWKAHAPAARATMVDTTDALLLRPARPTSGFTLAGSECPPLGASALPQGIVVATLYHFAAPVGGDFLDFFERSLRPAMIEAGAPVLASFVTEDSTNSFPALPVREGENVFVWFSRFQDRAAYDRHRTALTGSQDKLAAALARHLKGPPEVLRLAPTARSLLR